MRACEWPQAGSLEAPENDEPVVLSVKLPATLPVPPEAPPPHVSEASVNLSAQSRATTRLSSPREWLDSSAALQERPRSEADVTAGGAQASSNPTPEQQPLPPLVTLRGADFKRICKQLAAGATAGDVAAQTLRAASAGAPPAVALLTADFERICAQLAAEELANQAAASALAAAAATYHRQAAAWAQGCHDHQPDSARLLDANDTSEPQRVPSPALPPALLGSSTREERRRAVVASHFRHSPSSTKSSGKLSERTDDSQRLRMEYSLPDSDVELARKQLSMTSGSLRSSSAQQARRRALLRVATVVSHQNTARSHAPVSEISSGRRSSKAGTNLALDRAVRKAAQLENAQEKKTDLLERLRRTFERIDRDGSGFITLEELQEQAMNLPVEQKALALQALKKAVKSADKNGDDRLDFEEFAELMSGASAYQSRRMWTLWAKPICCVLSVLFFFVVAPLVYCNLNDDDGEWSVWDALYFAAVTLTTVGYGDLSPVNDEMMAFTIFFILYAVCIVAHVLNEGLYSVMAWYSQSMKGLRLSVMTKAAEAAEEFHCNGQEEVGANFWVLAGSRTAVALALILTPILVGTIFIGFNEDWPWLHALYWSVVTSTTVGYGDLRINLQSSRIFTTFYLLVGMGMIGAGVASLAALRMEVFMACQTSAMVQRFLAMDIIAELDLDGDGVDRCEFICGMLLQLQLVDPSTIEGLMKMFSSLDADGTGLLTHESLTNYCVTHRKGEAMMTLHSDAQRLQPPSTLHV